jgi:hypothetical protein
MENKNYLTVIQMTFNEEDIQKVNTAFYDFHSEGFLQINLQYTLDHMQVKVESDE